MRFLSLLCVAFGADRSVAIPLRGLRGAAACVLTLQLLACGGGSGVGGGGEDDPSGDPSAVPRDPPVSVSQPAHPAPAKQPPTRPPEHAASQPQAPEHVASQPQAPVVVTRAEAVRLLNQATFGPIDSDVERVIDIGITAWVDEQLAMRPRAVHVGRWNTFDLGRNHTDWFRTQAVRSSFYQEALRAPDQLRQRVAFALSEIFVVSMTDLTALKSESAAGYLDTLTLNAFSNYRTLLERVALHPAMGMYLSHLKNRKEDPASGRLPDQNFAREVMQLFSIGVAKLDAQGNPMTDSKGRVHETYTPDDIVGMSRVFTGFSWAGPDTSGPRFWGTDPAQRDMTSPMQGYTDYHSTSEKRFLGTVVAPQTAANPTASLRAALDTLASHRNVGPFISRQLIQRLVTSHPSPEYVGRVAQVFNNNGSGVRGDLKAVVRAILLDTEARSETAAAGLAYGKLREPVLRLTAFLRAFNARSDDGRYLISATDDPASELAQSPLESPTVFNFYRPGFVPSSGAAAERGMTVPEMQITSEVSVAGYVNYMKDVVSDGVGMKGINGGSGRRDVQVNIDEELEMADRTSDLVNRVVSRLIGFGANMGLKAHMTAAVASIEIPPLKPGGGNQDAVDNAKRRRVQLAQLLVLASPEFIVQR